MSIEQTMSIGAHVRPRETQACCCEACGSGAGMSHAEVWRQVESDPYSVLPRTEVTLRSFFLRWPNTLLGAARRTLRSVDDLLPRFDKLIRPNGICLSGTWEIDAASPYRGLFAGGTRALAIVRASVGLTETRAGHPRAFGLAGKVFPTSDPDRRAPTANFFVIDDNAGTDAKHFVDAVMTNEPRFSLRASVLPLLPVLGTIAVAQRLADRDTGIRQLYPLLWHGTKPEGPRTPRYLMLRAAPGQRVMRLDFRDELRELARRGPIAFEIHVREDTRKAWERVGTLQLVACVASDSCDHRLHFAHPPWRAERTAPPTQRSNGQ